MLPLGISADIVLRIRPEAYEASFTALAVDITRALMQLTRCMRCVKTQSPNQRARQIG